MDYAADNLESASEGQFFQDPGELPGGPRSVLIPCKEHRKPGLTKGFRNGSLTLPGYGKYYHHRRLREDTQEDDVTVH